MSILELEKALRKCSDGALHPEYTVLLDQMRHRELTRDDIDFLCGILLSKKYFWEIHLEHLRVLLLNESAKAYDLKPFYLERIKKCRRLAMRVFYIRGYAAYASEEELNPIMASVCKSLEKNHDYIDYNCILSIAGLPYLAKTYGYDCFVQTLEKAWEEHKKINPLLQGYFTLNEELEQVELLPIEETLRRTKQWEKKFS